MTVKHKYQAYAAATQTVARTKQIVMLYDGVIRFIQHAKEAMREKRIEDRYRLLTKASDVVMGLQGCLDFDNGGEVARVLYNYYSTIYNRIFALHRSHNLAECDELIAELKKMRDVWQTIDHGAGEEGEAGMPPAAHASEGDQSIVLSA